MVNSPLIRPCFLGGSFGGVARIPLIFGIVSDLNDHKLI